ncbi:MAG TPA: hypothetical protein RMG48_12690 [Myxococcales bacterium LLY-WYZ-16_1]|jgi:hypothetical protein|nr:hypothetical protein [Myxococcales bacterium LLY-WYZ-16_1]
MRGWKRWVGLSGLGLVLLGLLGFGWVLWASEPRPRGIRDREAVEAMARRLEAAVNLPAWRDGTGAVRWTFAGRRTHLWDRERGLVQVQWGDRRGLLRIGTSRGVAFRGDERVRGPDAEAILEQTYAAWVNDAFWLNPLAKLRDPGVELRRVDLDSGETGLLVRYTQGGLTPGDAYLWLFGEEDLPRAWKMWVSNVPVGGMEVTWEGWKTLSTGAVVSTRHESPPVLTLELKDVEAAPNLPTLLGDTEDPFAPWLEELGV